MTSPDKQLFSRKQGMIPCFSFWGEREEGVCREGRLIQ